MPEDQQPRQHQDHRPGSKADTRPRPASATEGGAPPANWLAAPL